MGKPRGVQLTPMLRPVSYSGLEPQSGRIELRLPGTSVSTPDGEVMAVEKINALKLCSRFTYIMVESASLQNGSEQEQLSIANYAAGWDRASALRGVWKEVGEDIQFFSAGSLLDFATEEKSSSSTDEKEPITIFAPGGSDQLMTIVGLRYWAWGSPCLLSQRGIETLMGQVPDTVVDLLSTALPLYDPAQSNAAGQARVFPVLDPLVILRCLTQKYYEACDAYLLHIGNYQPPSPVRPAPGEHGSVAYHKYQAALAVRQLTREGKPVPDTAASRRAEEFEKLYQGDAYSPDDPSTKGLKQFIEEREVAAQDIVNWLESEPYRLLPKVLREDDGTFDSQAEEEGFLAYLAHKSFALMRMPESECGKAYLFKIIDESQKANPTGTAALLAEFVLPNKSPSKETSDLAKKGAESIVDIWDRLAPLILSRVASGVGTYKIGGKAVTNLKDAAVGLASQIRYLFDDDLLEVVGPVIAKLKIRLDDKLADLDVSHIQWKVKKSTIASATGAVSAAAKSVEASLEALNAALSFAACREAIKNNKYDAESISTAFGLAKSLAFFGEVAGDVAHNSAGLRQAMFGNFKAEAFKKISTKLAIWGAAFDVAAASADTVASYNRGDSDAAAASAVASIGAGIVLGTLMLSGPIGWLVVGAVVGASGSMAAIALKDTPFEKLVKFSAFGNGSPDASMDTKDQAWTLATNYAEWAPQTVKGLHRFFQAYNQLQFAFSVKAGTSEGFKGGVKASDAYFTIEAQQLLPQSKFHVEYTAEYAPAGEREPVKPPLKGQLWLLSLSESPTLVDYGGHYPTGTEDIIVKGGQVKLRLRTVQDLYATAPDGSPSGTLLELFSLTLSVRLDVTGDGTVPKQGADSSIVLPTTAGGVKWVKFERKTAHSYDQEFIE